MCSTAKYDTDLEVTDPALYQLRRDEKLRELTLSLSPEGRAALKERRDASFAARRGRIMASVFQRVSNMRPSTACTSLLDTLLYDDRRYVNQYGRQNRERAIREYERETGASVQCPVGLVVHPQHCFLAATPDGWVAEDLILEVKCPERAENTPLRTLADTVSSFCLDRDMRLRRGHAYYGEVQAQMACCGVRYCDFFVWTPHEAVRDRIEFDPEFFQQKLGPVSEFFYECVLPELVDPRKARGLPYRERPSYTPNAN